MSPSQNSHFEPQDSDEHKGSESTVKTEKRAAGCEQKEQTQWLSTRAVHLRRLQSDAVALQRLKEAHPEASTTSLYGNAAKIATNARQAVAYETIAEQADLTIKPLLLYYGYLHWMKTILYLRDLSYPRGSSLLQHGMSVRKVKRDVYRWPLDYAYIYKEGVLQSFRDVVQPDLLLPTKLPIGHLLGSIPTVASAVAEFYPEFQHVYPALFEPDVEASDGVSVASGHWYVSRRIASNIGLTTEEWVDAFTEVGSGNQRSSWGNNRDRSQISTIIAREIMRGDAREMNLTEVGSLPALEDEGERRDRDPEGLLTIPAPDLHHPWVLHGSDGLWVNDGHAYPVWLSHLVTVYVLSTLCRYNAVEWLDIVHWNNDKDAYLVRAYLESVPHFPELMETVRPYVPHETVVH
ncbi:hypothetical protein JI721_06320 [Alicyclobacillus cycloheptanicus]|uniref:YaaC-like Protein n=1 Tax=Alicyclobacillus cycloheptanicus TaxID=1457 RepID=A0ABT9XLV1_9BACL|nr:YaaC family protein [Alicyclobacillus cycloheptanicus]MDQ0191286.1 hypothetical protein [Alicyclobacillus cycloheptanicus]WDM02407.1 hypothetical protein JI721_06320 [Alicyclobacillus cycloheptanicus]